MPTPSCSTTFWRRARKECRRREQKEGRTSSGPAYDPNGKRYRFNYENTAVYTIPVNGTVVVAQMKDLFILRGGAKANRIYASFDWLWTFPAELAGDYPFAAGFPPADNWAQFDTTGNPLGCDPI